MLHSKCPSLTEAYNCAGDLNTLAAARLQARQNFEANRILAAGSEELSKQIMHAEEVAKFLRENVVQGEAIGNDTGSYSELGIAQPLRAYHSLKSMIGLRIHEHTERGNNEDIKKGKGNTLAGTKCCSS